MTENNAADSGKRILILYTSHTFGHKTIAENIAYYLNEAGFETKLFDILEINADNRLVKWTRKIHRLVNEFVPWLWRWLYLNSWFTKMSLSWRYRVAGKNFQKTKKIIDDYNPDLIITTQTSASAVVAYLKQQGLFAGKFAIAFSDYHLHRYWLYDEADLYLANLDEQKQEMIALGVPKEKIMVCGITLKPKPNFDPKEIKNRLGIPLHHKVVLVSGGSFGFGINADLLNGLALKKEISVIVVCGKNQQTWETLAKASVSDNLKIYKFYQPMQELYAIADLFLSKAGALSVAEALQYRLPVLIYYLLPGQEELNFDYLNETGLVMPEPLSLGQEVLEELAGGSFKNRLSGNEDLTKVLGNGSQVVTAVVDLLG